MEKSKKQKSFRSSLGGFNKKDVVGFIAEENRKFSNEKAKLSEEIESKEKIISQLEEKVASLLEENERLRDELSRTKGDLDSVVRAAEEHTEYTEKAISDLTENYGRLASDKAEIEKERDDALSALEKMKTDNAHLRQAAGKNAETLAKYVKHIQELEQTCDTSKEENNSRINELKRQNEALRAIISQAEEKFDTASGYISQLEKRFEELDGVYSKRDVSGVTEKAIDSIIAINDDVKDYMGSCVDEFDKYSQDVTSGITKLLEEMTGRCRMLEQKIAESKNAAMKNIDSRYFDN